MSHTCHLALKHFDELINYLNVSLHLISSYFMFAFK